jgi:peptide/nickel transport system permease protein
MLSLPPDDRFLLGTDNLGRDYLSRLLHAGRATLLVGLGANAIAITLGTLVGVVAAYAGTPKVGLRGRSVGIPVEGSLMRFTDVGLAFPALLLAIALSAVFHPSLELVAIVIASVLWAGTARLVYARSLLLRRSDFVLAAVAVGTRPRRIVRRHLLPHLLPLIIVLGAAGIAVTVLFEATLSFLGAGAPLDAPTWGRMLAETRGHYRTDLRLPLLPGVAIFLTVFAFTLLGDALSDALDPHGWRR